MPTHYTFSRLSDGQILDLMDNLLKLFKTASATVTVGDLTSFTVSKTEGEPKDSGDRSSFSKLLNNNTYLITEFTWQAGSATHSIKYYRKKVWGLNIHQQQGWQDAPNPFLDSIEVRSSETNAAPILSVIQKHVSMAPPIVDGPEAGTAMDQSQAILNRLSAAIATLVEHTADRQKDLDETRESISHDAAERIRQEKSLASEKIKDAEKSYLQKENALIEREKELDDRANTHVRREFAKQMAALSDTRLSSNLLSKSNLSFFVPLAISLIPIAFLCYLITSEINHITAFNNNISDIVKDFTLKAEQKTIIIGNINYQILYAQIRIALQSVGIAALVWFSLKLASSRYSLVSNWERDLHKFRLDTERAGFLVEGDLEARKVNQKGLPDVLLESFSRNLFANSDGGHSARGDEGLGGALTALLGQAAKVRVGPDGVNVEVEGRGIRRAKRLIEDDA